MKKNSYGLISALNESFESDIKEKKAKALKESQKLKENLSKEDIMKAYISDIMEFLNTYRQEEAQKEINATLRDLKNDKALDDTDKAFVMKMIKPSLLDRDIKIDVLNEDQIEDAKKDSIKKGLYTEEAKNKAINPNDLTKEQLWKLRQEIVLGSLYINDYENSFGIDPNAVCSFFDSFIEYAQQDDEGNYNERDIKDFDNPEELYNYYYGCENPFGDLEESASLSEEVKKHNFAVQRNGINQGVYFITKDEAENFISEMKSKGLDGNYKIVYSNKADTLTESNLSNIQGLESYSEAEIKKIATDYIKQALIDADVDTNDFEIVDMNIYGSRGRGTARNDSDLDIVFEYTGDMREDDLFNILHDEEEPLMFDDIKVDLNPINAQRSGDMKSFMDRAKAYDKSKLQDSEKPKKVTKLIDKAKMNEEDIVLVNAVNAEPDYVITDVTELEDVNPGDIQSPDIDAMLSMIQESIKEKYGEDSIKIHIHSSGLLENGSFVLVDITTPEVLKEFAKIKSKDTAVGKSLILENKIHGITEFRVNNTSGSTAYIKRTKEPAKAIMEWLETEFLSEAKKAKEEEESVHRRIKLEDTINQFLSNNADLRLAIETLKMFIEVAGKDEETKKAIRDKIEKIVVEFPLGVTTTDTSLKFDNVDDIIEILFGKEWIAKEEKDFTPSVPGTKVINESYQQFAIGEIDVVYNPETQEVMYSIGADDTHDKKINLTKVPSVDVPYNTETIIKNHIEKQYGPIPEEIEDTTKETSDENLPLSTEEIPAETDTQLEEDDNEISQDAGLDQSTPEEDEALEDSKSETGSAKFQKIKPNSGVSVEDIRTKDLDGTVQADSQYIVVEEINLDDAQFNEFSNDVSKPQDFFTGVTPIDRKNYPFNVVKVTNANSTYDIIADPVGYNYGRYIAILDK